MSSSKKVIIPGALLTLSLLTATVFQRMTSTDNSKNIPDSDRATVNQLQPERKKTGEELSELAEDEPQLPKGTLTEELLFSKEAEASRPTVQP